MGNVRVALLSMKTLTLWIVAGIGLALLTTGALLPRPFGVAPIEYGPTVVCLVLGFLMLAGAMASIPSQIAQTRGHRNLSAISLCSIVGVVFFPAWIVALVWAYTAPRA